MQDILTRIEKALTELENIEHRVATIIEGNRAHLSTLIEDLRLRDLRHELREIAMILRYQSRKS